MHFKRKHFSEKCSEQLLTRLKIYLHKMGHEGKLKLDNVTHVQRDKYTTKQNQNMFFLNITADV